MASDAGAEGGARNAYLRWGFVLLVVAIVEWLAGTSFLPMRVRFIVFVGLVGAAVVLMVRPGRRVSKEGGEPAIEASELVRVAVAANSTEAAVVRGMLQANGVGCEVRQTDFGAGSMDGMPGGPQQVLVSERDASRARELLAGGR